MISSCGELGWLDHIAHIMRKSAAWMTLWDDRILEIIRNEESGNATDLSENKYIRVSRTQVGRRLRKLADHGLLKPLGNGVYIITEQGEQYLDGKIDADELPNLSEGEGTANA